MYIRVLEKFVLLSAFFSIMPRFGASAVAAINISVAREGSALLPERRKRLKRVSPSTARNIPGFFFM